MRIVKLCLFFATVLVLSSPAVHAGHGTVGPVTIERISTVPFAYVDPSNAAFYHKPGNFEINLLETAQLPNGVNCDQKIFTTLGDADMDKTMFQTLLAAVTSGQRVYLGVTDNPQYNAFPGRCSLLYVSLLKKP
ncbi:MAG TPA: hypothetical protein VH394_20840 [Thermoanaerobaculia bacterium]|nr:hypothetical protein [Thermoanaerobaculia bacterium]